jgi:hypothetical protein
MIEIYKAIALFLIVRGLSWAAIAKQTGTVYTYQWNTGDSGGGTENSNNERRGDCIMNIRAGWNFGIVSFELSNQGRRILINMATPRECGIVICQNSWIWKACTLFSSGNLKILRLVDCRKMLSFILEGKCVKFSAEPDSTQAGVHEHDFVMKGNIIS